MLQTVYRLRASGGKIQSFCSDPVKASDLQDPRALLTALSTLTTACRLGRWGLRPPRTPFPRSLRFHFRPAPAHHGLHFPKGMALEGRKWRPPRWTPGEGGRLPTRHAVGAGTGRSAGLHFPAALLVQRLRCVTAAGGRWRRQRLWRGAAEGARGGRRPEPR